MSWWHSFCWHPSCHVVRTFLAHISLTVHIALIYVYGILIVMSIGYSCIFSISQLVLCFHRNIFSINCRNLEKHLSSSHTAGEKSCSLNSPEVVQLRQSPSLRVSNLLDEFISPVYKRGKSYRVKLSYPCYFWADCLSLQASKGKFVYASNVRSCLINLSIQRPAVQLSQWWASIFAFILLGSSSEPEFSKTVRARYKAYLFCLAFDETGKERLFY